MSSASEEIATRPEGYYPAPEAGIVIDNEDPLGLHRCRIEIPGLALETGWAMPFGTDGGGSKQRGAHTVPDVGADVVVMFIGGDPLRPIYICGNWGLPKGVSEMPSEAVAVGSALAHKIQSVHESSRVKVWVDERAGKEQISIQDKNDPDVFFQIDISQGTIAINATAAILIKSIGIVRIEGAQVVINDRAVLTDSKPL